MQQQTSKMLYEYWNDVRNGRRAPCRYEIDPARIAALLPETFIAECGEPQDYRIRLAGTRICDQFGAELRGSGLLDFWKPQDREALETLLHNVTVDGAVAVARFAASLDGERSADFEITLMPLVHTGQSLNRILGCITAIDPPFWLGSGQLVIFELKTVDLIWPDGQPHFLQDLTPATADAGPQIKAVDEKRRRFRVLEGGLSDTAR